MEEFRTFRVPQEIELAVSVLVEELKRVPVESEPFPAGDVALIKPDIRQFDAGSFAGTALFVASAQVIGWISKAWLDKYVFPVILERFDSQSRAFEDWLRKTVGIAHPEDG